MNTLERKLARGKGCVSRVEKEFLESLDSSARRALFAAHEWENDADRRIARLLAEGVPPAKWPKYALERYVGGIADPSKMPGFAYGIPAAECGTGTALRSVPGSTCAKCYAYLRGNYRWINVLQAQYRRLESLERPLWVACMAAWIQRSGAAEFRVHDSGDLQSLAHLLAICKLARLCPDVAFWIPTREYRIIAEFRKGGHRIPANLDIRISAHKLGGRAPNFGPRFSASGVSNTPGEFPEAHHCPAPQQGNNCGDCRACFERVPLVIYHLH